MCLVKLCQYKEKIVNWVRRKDEIKDKILKDIEKQTKNVLKVKNIGLKLRIKLTITKLIIKNNILEMFTILNKWCANKAKF